MTSSSSRPGEFVIIARVFAPLATHPGAFGLKDDVALLAPPLGKHLVLKTDAAVEGVHYRAEDPPGFAAQKALRTNLSDLAAKGAEPAGYLLSLSVRKDTPLAWFEAFAQGLKQDQEEFSISLLGGDTTATPGPVTIAITAIGWVSDGKLIRRSGARPGDLVFVSGTIGDAAAGLALLQGEASPLGEAERARLIARYRVPLPRLALGQALRGLASAALDVSDGLVADCGHLADASNVRIELDAARVPLDPALAAWWGAGAAERAATAGDDYEIAFTAPPKHRAAILSAAAETGTPVSEIGRVVAGQGVVLLDANGRPLTLASTGYTHL